MYQVLGFRDEFPYCAFIDGVEFCLDEELFNITKDVIALEESDKRIIEYPNLPSNSNYPEFNAFSPGQAFYVLYELHDTELIQNCAYVGNYFLERYRYRTMIKIYDIKTGEKIIQKIFYGGEPETCPRSRKFNSSTEKVYGSSLDEVQIKNWLKRLLN
jgi:hypothetical protein